MVMGLPPYAGVSPAKLLYTPAKHGSNDSLATSSRAASFIARLVACTVDRDLG